MTTHAPASASFNQQFTVAATGGGSGNAVTFSSSGACSNSGATFTITSATGTCSVKYDQAGDSNYNAAPQVTETVSVGKTDQTITVTTHAPASAVFNTSFTVAATGGGSGNPVTFSSAGSCTNVGATFTMTSGTGTCTVKYDQAGDANYNAAPQVTETVNAQKADQTINVTTHAPASAAYNSSFSVAATAPGGSVSFSSSGSCTNTAASFTITSGSGTCSVKYDQAGDANYNAAPQVTETVNAQKANQTIIVTLHAPASAVYNTGFSVAASGGGSGNAVTFSSAGSCSNTGDSFTMTSGTGTCTVKYDQAGDANYNAAPQVTETVNAQKASQTITFAPLRRQDLRRPGLHGQRDGELRPDGLVRRLRPVHRLRHHRPPDGARQLHDHGLAGRRLELQRRDRRARGHSRSTLRRARSARSPPTTSPARQSRAVAQRHSPPQLRGQERQDQQGDAQPARRTGSR